LLILPDSCFKVRSVPRHKARSLVNNVWKN
jgi:hypothetical protein